MAFKIKKKTDTDNINNKLLYDKKFFFFNFLNIFLKCATQAIPICPDIYIYDP